MFKSLKLQLEKLFSKTPTELLGESVSLEKPNHPDIPDFMEEREIPKNKSDEDFDQRYWGWGNIRW